ncbi:hypothetical protein [Chitinivorax sp. B]|uniref:hypothetical protein n=1 Tax=Chitinivorax sp. B TaxID=2502235 RepID=UPI0010F5B728|nr:hypothetical protein [Chitinivorax sp. B]
MKLLRRDPVELTASQLRLVKALRYGWWVWLLVGLAVAWYVRHAVPTEWSYWLSSAVIGMVGYRALVHIDLRSRGAPSIVFGLIIFFLMPLAKWLGGATEWPQPLHLAGTLQYLGCVFASWGICARIGRRELIALQSTLSRQLDGQLTAAEESEPGWARRISVRRRSPTE